MWKSNDKNNKTLKKKILDSTLTINIMKRIPFLLFQYLSVCLYWSSFTIHNDDACLFICYYWSSKSSGFESYFFRSKWILLESLLFFLVFWMLTQWWWTQMPKWLFLLLCFSNAKTQTFFGSNDDQRKKLIFFSFYLGNL